MFSRKGRHRQLKSYIALRKLWQKKRASAAPAPPSLQANNSTGIAIVAQIGIAIGQTKFRNFIPFSIFLLYTF
jgi:hypothetical protein